MPETLTCPPRANDMDPSVVSNRQEANICVSSESPTESSTSTSSPTNSSSDNCTSGSSSHPSPNRSPSRWSSSSSGSPTFRERLRSASKLIPKSPVRTRLATTPSSDNSDQNKVKPKPQLNRDGFRSHFREHFILSELKLLSKNHQTGVYIMPSFNNLQVWHGIIFLRAGPYRDGIFRFFVFLPDDFPDSRPLLKFTTPVFHPQIHLNGVLSLDVVFPKWQKEKHCVWQILRYMKSCFYYADTWGATNEAATNVIHNSLEEFKKKVQECVLQSQRLYDSEMNAEYSVDDGNHLKVKKMSVKEFEDGRKMMLQGKLPPRNYASH